MAMMNRSPVSTRLFVHGAPLCDPSSRGKARYNRGSNQPIDRRILLADDKLYKAEFLGSGTFVISKPKRKKIKMRQSQLKNPQRGSRK